MKRSFRYAILKTRRRRARPPGQVPGSRHTRRSHIQTKPTCRDSFVSVFTSRLLNGKKKKKKSDRQLKALYKNQSRTGPAPVCRDKRVGLCTAGSGKSAMAEAASVGLQGQRARLNNRGIITLQPRIFPSSPHLSNSLCHGQITSKLHILIFYSKNMVTITAICTSPRPPAHLTNTKIHLTKNKAF